MPNTPQAQHTSGPTHLRPNTPQTQHTPDPTHPGHDAQYDIDAVTLEEIIRLVG